MLSSKTIPSLQFFCPACAGGMETPIAWGGQQRPCPHCATSVAVPLVVGLIPEPGSPEGGEKRRILKVRTPAMPGSRLGENVSKEPPRLPKPGVVLHEGGGPVVQASPSILKSDNPGVPAIPAEPSPEIAPIALSVAPSSTPFPAPGGGIPGVFQTPWVAGAPRREVSPDQVVHSGAVPPPVPWAVSSFISPSCKLAGWGKKSPLRRRLGIFVPVVGAALLCSAAVAAWRVWPASGYFPYLLEPDAEMLFHYQPPPPRVSLVPTAESRADLFEEFAAEGFHFRPPTDYWERLDQAASPFSLLRPAFTLRRTESSPPSEFGIASCDFAISTDILPTGTGVDDGWQNLPSIVALQARFSCGLPERYEVNISGAQPGRFLRLVWDMLPAENGEPARHLEMWVQQRGRIAWSLTGIMPGSTASYSLTSTLQRLASGFSALDVDPELIRLSLNDRDLSGAALVSSLPTPHLLHRWTSLPPGTTTWPGGQFLAPGADTTWAVGRARIALVTLPPDGLGGLPPSRLLTGMRQLWPALRGLSFPSIDPSDSPDGKTFRLTVAGTFDGSAAQCVVHWHRSPQGAVMAFAFQPEAVDFPTPDPALLLGGLDLIPQPADKAGPPAPPSAVYLPLLDALAGEAQADGRPKEASALHLALFGRSHRLEDLATACGSLAAGGQLDTAIRLFEAGGERFTHTPGWELYRILVMARLGAGPLAHRHAMDLLSSRRFPGSLASPYLNALIESRSWPQAKTFASMLVRNDPASAQWRLHYASILAETGERSKAISIIHATQQTWPDDATLGIECVQTLLRFKCPQDASGLAGRVALAHPDHEQAQLIFGQCLILLGSNDEARLAYQRALKAAPASHTARQALASLASISAQSDTAFITTAIDPVALPALLTHSLPAVPDNFHAPSLFLSRITGLRHQRGRPPATTVRSRILIINSEGMSQWNTLSFPLDPHRERLALHHLNVMDSAGKIIARGHLPDRYTLEAQDGTLTVHFPVPGLVPGCIIDYAVTTENLAPASTWGYTRHSFALPSPGLADIFYVTGDTTSLTWEHSQNHEPIRTGDCLLWREDQSALPARSGAGKATLHLGTVTATWESTGLNYLEQIRHRLSTDHIIKQAATTITAGLKDRRAKIEAIARRVRSDISYTAIEFGYRAIIPQSAAVTLHNRFGDCKDHAVLLHSLLAAAGIPSHLGLIHSSLPTQPGFPALSQFDHMIVALPSDKGGIDFIDCTDKFLEPVPGCAPAGLTSRQVLMLDPARPRLVSTPDTEAPSTGRIGRLVEIGQERDARITDRLTLTGPAAANLRALLAPLPPDGHLPALRRLMGLDRLREQLLEVTITSLRDPSQPLDARLVWQSREALRPASHGLHLFLTTPLADYLLFPPALSDSALDAPLRITAPIQLHLTVTVRVPEGLRLNPPDFRRPHGKRPLGSWTTTATSDTSLTWSANLEAGTWHGPEAASARHFPIEALKPLRQPWLLSGGPPPPRPLGLPRDQPSFPVFPVLAEDFPPPPPPRDHRSSPPDD